MDEHADRSSRSNTILSRCLCVITTNGGMYSAVSAMCVRSRPVDHTTARGGVGPDLLIRMIADWEEVTKVEVAPE